MGVPTYRGKWGCLRIGGMDVPTYRGKRMCLRIGGNVGAYV